MIYYIRSSEPFQITIEEKENDREEYLEKVADVYMKYNSSIFMLPNGRIFTAKLISKTQIRECVQGSKYEEGMVTSWVIKDLSRIILLFKYEELKL